MRIVMERDACDDKIKVLLEIDGHEYVRARLDRFDHLLIADCEGSNKVSDKLLMLETIARRIEESSAPTNRTGE